MNDHDEQLIASHKRVGYNEVENNTANTSTVHSSNNIIELEKSCSVSSETDILPSMQANQEQHIQPSFGYSQHTEKQIEHFIREADEKLNSKNIHEALQLYTKALDFQPNHQRTYILCKRGQAYLLAELYDECINDCREVLTLSSSDQTDILLVTLICLARAFSETNDFEKGRHALSRAIEMATTDYERREVSKQIKIFEEKERAYKLKLLSQNRHDQEKHSALTQFLSLIEEPQDSPLTPQENQLTSNLTSSSSHSSSTTTFNTATDNLDSSSSSPNNLDTLSADFSNQNKSTKLTTTTTTTTTTTNSSPSSMNQKNPLKRKRNQLHNHDDDSKSSCEDEEIAELECPLCYRVFYEPVTLPCGHTFDRECLSRVLDYTAKCPLCREVIHIIPSNYPVTHCLNNLLEKYGGKDYTTRAEEEREKKEKEKQIDINNVPLFILDYVLFPNCLLPLHIFEPRYRLLIRRCVSGSKCFGLVACGPNGEISKYGTIAKIKSVQMLPDGRSLVETVGERRFKILNKWEQDGYTCGRISWIEDEDVGGNEEEKKKLRDICEKGHKVISNAFNGFQPDVRSAIEKKIGKIPPLSEPKQFSFWLASILPLQTQVKVNLLKQTSTTERLRQVLDIAYEIISHYQPAGSSCTIS